jgi:Cu(I)/Ag(I) efflux system membrane fusion protein
LALVGTLTAGGRAACAQSVRAHTRLESRGTAVTEAQASELTLTLTQVVLRPIQVWVRAAGTIDRSAELVTVSLGGADARFVTVGQRARTFPVRSRSSMSQGRVVAVAPDGPRTRVAIALAATGQPSTKGLVVEIVTERGEFLSVPNEAIIEEGDAQVVYLKTADGRYEPKTIRTGLQGELYTQVLGGVTAGDQVVTFGSFFIDSEYKLKGTAQGSP